jgi:hypothetical protein
MSLSIAILSGADAFGLREQLEESSRQAAGAAQPVPSDGAAS